MEGRRREEITVSAKTLDDAITEALVQLGVTSDRLEYDVIEKGSAGFLGIGMKQAVIRAWRKEEPQEETVDEIAEEFIKEAVPSDITLDIKEEKEPRKPKKENREPKKAPQKQVRKETKKEYRKENKSEEKPEIKRETELARVEDATVAECENFLRSVLHAMHMEVELHSEVDEEGALAIEMKGDNMGILIGKRGQTLDSLQYLTNRVANKMQAGYVRVKLDTEDYRRRRKETLENLAKNIAHKVKRTRKPITLEPMNPYERRIIHSALQGDKNVTTHSEGEEPYRRVVVTLVRK
ncbi:RNA-binding cell elongation regulator Jag/EloR [Lachnoclostridium sp. An118]|uniref:RNA-binding cell elongation regulator Jag/EloR n=1 Tax=Lachnoclostridium sp. An118 TaxID=1965547 RepID=UPI000B37829F|nr:RNA-binding cell elongation regulator Jag/EloR [Lachnoclostridium sp. An118]OUQ49230.1 RNA-binding protein [Lachnoclostridium sp. An118]